MLPNYSPTQGKGATFSDPATGTNYLYGDNGWYQISSGGLPKAPAPTAPKIPAPSAPAPQQSGTPAVDMKYYQGWNDQAAIQADWAKTWQQKTGQQSGGGSGQSDDIMKQIDQLYGNTNQIYDKYINQQLPQELTNTLGSIETQKAQSERAAQSALQQAMADFKSQQDITAQGQVASESALLRQRNAAVQQGQNQYGGGSSAGQAIYEIINQEFLRNSGNVKVAAQNAFTAIFKESAKAQNFYQDYMAKLNEDVKLAMEKANSEFNNRLLQVQMAKAQNEDAKNQAKIALLQETRAQAQNVANWKMENVLALETWMAQQKDTLNNSTKYVSELASKLSNNQLFAGYQDTLESTPSKQNISMVNDQVNTNYLNNKKDPWSEITNPFV